MQSIQDREPLGAPSVPVSTATATPTPDAKRARVIAAFTRTARGFTRLAGAATARFGGSALGAAGLAMTAVGAGAQWGVPVGLMVGGPLTVWLATLLPREATPPKAGGAK